MEQLVIVSIAQSRWTARHLASLPALNSVRKIVIADVSLIAAGQVDEFNISPAEISKAKAEAEAAVNLSKELIRQEWEEEVRRFAPYATIEVVAPDKTTYNFSKPFAGIR